MKYDAQLGEFKNKLSEAKRVLIALPTSVNNDKMAGALALYLSLKQSGKDVAVVSEAEIRVSQSVLFGIGDVKTDLPEVSSGNFILGLEGVVVDGKVPALVDLNWYPEGTTLNLVFNVVPGEKFEPINISHHYDSASFDLIIIIGAPTLAGLGNVYNNNLEKFTDTPKINIDNSSSNNLFGVVNIIDQGVPVSEMVMHIMQGLSLPQDPDIATNIITGVYDSTRGLTSNVTAETFLAIGEAMKMGGKIVRQTGDRPQQQTQPSNQRFQQQPRNDGNRPARQNDNRGRQDRADNRNQPNQNSSQNQNSPVAQTQPVDEEKPVGEILQPFKEDLEPAVKQSLPANEGQRDSVSADQPISDSEEPVSQPTSEPETETPTVADTAETPTPSEQAPSQFEAPSGEQAVSSSPESGTPPSDWLTPKLFSGKGLG